MNAQRRRNCTKVRQKKFAKFEEITKFALVVSRALASNLVEQWQISFLL
jgi:hypothetical protein